MGKKNKAKKSNAAKQLLDSELGEEKNASANDEVSLKRNFENTNFDEEDMPVKKKKKKKQPVVQESSEKKGKKSIRQMKREKFAQRQAEAQSQAKDQLKAQCVQYLSQWKHNRDDWKFMKAKQVWLFKNKFSSYLVPDSSWPVLLEYFESAKGNIRNMLLEDANKVIKQMDEWTESQTNRDVAEKDEGEDAETESNKPDEISYKRARDLIQCLQE